MKYSEKSFLDIDMWLKDLKLNASPDIKIVLIGNKSDLEEERLISKKQAEDFKNEYELDFFMETSAKNGINTKELFVKVAKLLFTEYCKYNIKNKKEGEELSPQKLNKSSKKKCC